MVCSEPDIPKEVKRGVLNQVWRKYPSDLFCENISNTLVNWKGFEYTEAAAQKVFLVKGVLKICCKFTEEQNNFIEIFIMGVLQ